MIKNDRPIEADELSLAAEHLAFDFFYFRLYKRLNKDIRLAFSLHGAHQAITYALLLHFRVLLDFFHMKPVKDDCCVIHFIDFIPEFKTSFGEVEEPLTLKIVRDNLHKRLAHMTATRWREVRPEMDYYENTSMTSTD